MGTRAALNRRQFLTRSGVAAAGFWIGGPSFGAISPNEKLNLGVIGTADRAAENLAFFASENIVALCDVDSNYLSAARKKFPKAETYRDFRKMLDRKDLDAVVISTPDHTHAVAAIAAMESGRHVYCETPMAHTISETRRMMEIAREYHRVTQTGMQFHALENYRQVVDLIRGGTIGTVNEAHVWLGGVNTTVGRPERGSVPSGLDWDLWLGPLPSRDFSPQFVPRRWWSWWAFGGGTLPYIGCHYIDLVHWAMALSQPNSVEAEGPKPDADSAPPWMIVRYEYPARGEAAPFKLTWHYGSREGKPLRPPQFAVGEPAFQWARVLFVGDKGMLAADYSRHALLPSKDFPQESAPIVDNDYEARHHQEWIQAIKTRDATSCSFDYSGPLAETLLLGNVAYRSGAKITWNPMTLQATGNADADRFIQHQYRSGWKI